MTSPNATFTELVSTTFRKHKKTYADNVSNNNAFYAAAMRKGRKRLEDGGLTIACGLDYAENGTFQRYSGYDALNVTASDVISSAEYEWKQAAVHITASGRELRINSGDSAIVSLAKKRLENAMRTFKNNISSDLYSDGSAANQINGLQSIVSDAANGTVGGISSSSFTFWERTLQSAAAPIQGGGAVTLSKTTFEDDFMLPLYTELTRGSDKPDLIPMSNEYYKMFESSQTSLKRYTTDADLGSNSANAGLISLKYKGADVVHDGGSGIPAAHAYFLNTDFLEVVCHRDADMDEETEMRAINQDACVIPILWMGNVTCSNRSLQGVAKA